MADPTITPLRIGLLVFPGFQALDAFGPLDAFNILSLTHRLTISVISETLDSVSTKPAHIPTATGQTVVPTHDFTTVPPLDVLLIPGGWGTHVVSDRYITFIRDQYPRLRYLITVCTGARLAARAGVLDGKRATTNKMDWQTVVCTGPNVKWVSHARWVVDGNCWTASGVTAGIDVAFAWIEELYGRDVATEVAHTMEYERHEDSTWDPFAEILGLPNEDV